MTDPVSIVSHYERIWGKKGEPLYWNQGPTWQLPADFHVLAFAPSSKREMWTYATCGMSQQGDATPIELHLFSPTPTDQHVELLTMIAHYHLTGDYLDAGHTVNFGRPWLPGSICDHGLLSLPYLDGPNLEWLEAGDRKIRFLWLIPITPDEIEFKKQRGLEALEARFEKYNFDYLDPSRKSVVQFADQ